MKLMKWLDGLFTEPSSTAPVRRAKSPASRLAAVEALEERLLLSTYQVTFTADRNLPGACVAAPAPSPLGCSLREAISAANASVGVADTIVVPGGIYTLALGPAGDDANANGDLDLTDTATTRINGAGALGSDPTMINGGGLDRVFHVVGANAKAEFFGIAITGGTAAFGGGINNEGTATVDQSIVALNFATAAGGGIYNAGTLTVTNNSSVSGNTTNGEGAGIRNAGGTATVIDSTISGNTAAGNGGGVSNGAVLHVTRSDITDNTATNGNGGGTYNTGTAVIVYSTVSDNFAGYDGAGLWNNHTAIVENSTFTENTAARHGGAIFNSDTLTVINSTISGNDATDHNVATPNNGGGILNTGVAAATIINSTIFGNFAATAGSGIHNTNPVLPVVENSIITSNDGDECQGGIIGIRNLIDDFSCGVVAGRLPSSPVTGLDPNLASNGGPTQTHALFPGSNAINAGNNALLPNDSQDLDNDGDLAETIPVDQRGPGSPPGPAFPRIVGATVDVGAFEAPLQYFGLDFGDAPTAAQSGFAASYPTSLAANGARHIVIVGGPRLGAQLDAESNGQPTGAADGDDLTGPIDDEDGVTFPALLLPGTTSSVTIDLENPGPSNKLDAWIDFNRDGSWGAGEQIFADLDLGTIPGPQTLQILVPNGSSLGTTYARFRLSSAGGLAPTGQASDGEVEDHFVNIGFASGPVLALDFGDAPDTGLGTSTGNYQTTAADGGASHTATGPTLGPARDTESDGQPTVNANGDDLNGGTPDDEDGVTFLAPGSPPGLAIGGTFTVSVNLQNPGATNRLDAWIDFNRDGDWTDVGEQVFTNFNLGTVAGPQSLSFTVPANASVGTTYARFRLSTAGGLLPTGTASDGEVEDYQVQLAPPPPTCDAPSSAGSASVIVDPDHGPNLALEVRGTNGVDKLTVGLVKGQVQAKRGTVILGNFSPSSFQRIIICGFGGNDTIKINKSLAYPAFVDGGEGNDTIAGGGGRNILLGRGGNDTITGGPVQDLVIGGTGLDNITTRHKDEDVVTGEATLQDENRPALEKVLADWVSVNSRPVREQAVQNQLTIVNDNLLDKFVIDAGLDFLL